MTSAPKSERVRPMVLFAEPLVPFLLERVCGAVFDEVGMIDRIRTSLLYELRKHRLGMKRLAEQATRLPE